jgi:hypothetical protein
MPQTTTYKNYSPTQKFLVIIFCPKPLGIFEQAFTTMEIFKIDPETEQSIRDMDDEDLAAFAALQEDPESGIPIELSIFVHFLLFIRNKSTQHLEQACQQAEEWVEMTPEDEPDRERRVEIRDQVAVRKLQYTEQAHTADDIDPERLPEFSLPRVHDKPVELSADVYHLLTLTLELRNAWVPRS